jgi:hypothetical protein
MALQVVVGEPRLDQQKQVVSLPVRLEGPRQAGPATVTLTLKASGQVHASNTIF